MLEFLLLLLLLLLSLFCVVVVVFLFSPLLSIQHLFLPCWRRCSCRRRRCHLLCLLLLLLLLLLRLLFLCLSLRLTFSLLLLFFSFCLVDALVVIDSVLLARLYVHAALHGNAFRYAPSTRVDVEACTDTDEPVGVYTLYYIIMISILCTRIMYNIVVCIYYVCITCIYVYPGP